MRLEALARLIETADFLSFREIAIKALPLRGYTHPTLTDGPRDGGTDVIVTQLPPNPTPLAIQFSVEKRWPQKLRGDAEKVKSKYGVRDMLFVSSRRIPEADFQPLSTEIWRDLDIRVTRIDAQGIASTFFGHGKSGEVLQILGIEPAITPPRTPDRQSARADAAYAFAFFGAEPQRFRERMFEAAVVTVGARYPEGLARTDLETEVRAVLQLAAERGQIVTSTVDRLIQRGDFSSRSNRLVVEAQLSDTAAGLSALRDREWQEMETDLTARLSELLPEVAIKKLLPSVRDDIGALLISSADLTVQTLERNIKRGVAEDTVRRQLRHLHSSLDAYGVPTGETRSKVLEVITAVAGSSPIAKHIVAGEVYGALSSLSTPHLVSAMGAHSEIETYLDSSVAIPMLANLMYEPAREHRYFLAAFHLYEQLRSLQLPILLPPDYLEEVATHLYLAYQYYSAIVDLDPDLIASQNAFVAHYASLRLAGSRISFFKYLSGFGFDESLQRSTLPVARDALMPILRRHFDRYRITTIDLPHPGKAARKEADEMVARAIDALSLTRARVLQHHDAYTLACLSERQTDAARAVVLCTWDSMHFWILDHSKPTWDVMDPAVLADVLTLTARELEDAPLISISAISRLITDAGSREGAAVWDAIVQIERGALHDAELLAQAQLFKRNYLASRKQGLGSDDIAQAWVAWKSRERNGVERAG